MTPDLTRLDFLKQPGLETSFIPGTNFWELAIQTSKDFRASFGAYRHWVAMQEQLPAESNAVQDRLDEIAFEWVCGESTTSSLRKTRNLRKDIQGSTDFAESSLKESFERVQASSRALSELLLLYQRTEERGRSGQGLN